MARMRLPAGLPADRRLTTHRLVGVLASLCLLSGCSRLLVMASQGPVPPSGRPPAAIASSPGVRAAVNSVVQVVANVPGCRRQVVSSGFAYAPEHVLMTAHAIAGAAPGQVEAIARNGFPYTATVVLFDPGTDVAVLDVPGLPVPPLRFASGFRAGTAVAFAGYPGTAHQPGVVAGLASAPVAVHGADMYGAAVTRQEIAASIRLLPGNAGGPLLDAAGRVAAVAFAAGAGQAPFSYALPAHQVEPDAAAAAHRTAPVSDRTCA